MAQVAPRRVNISVEPITPETVEPPKGSVVMVHGLTGTAYQRLYDMSRADQMQNPDQEWFATTGVSISWANLVQLKGNHFIVIQADDTE